MHIAQFNDTEKTQKETLTLLKFAIDNQLSLENICILRADLVGMDLTGVRPKFIDCDLTDAKVDISNTSLTGCRLSNTEVNGDVSASSLDRLFTIQNKTLLKAGPALRLYGNVLSEIPIIVRSLAKGRAYYFWLLKDKIVTKRFEFEIQKFLEGELDESILNKFTDEEKKASFIEAYKEAGSYVKKYLLDKLKA